MSSVSLKPVALGPFSRGEEGQLFVVGRDVGMIETIELSAGGAVPMIYTDPAQAIQLAGVVGRSIGVKLIAYEAILTFPQIH